MAPAKAFDLSGVQLGCEHLVDVINGFIHMELGRWPRRKADVTAGWAG